MMQTDHHMARMSDAQESLLTSADLFPADYKAKMLRAYPVIAQMSWDEAYLATADERDEAFRRILAARNLRRTHELFLADREVTP